MIQMSENIDHALYNLKPKHRIFGQHIMVNDALPNRILSGTVQVKSSIRSFSENGVIFEGETEETPVDAVIFATGYQFKFPFFDESETALHVRDGNELDLYRLVFPPTYKHAHTMAFVGLIQPIGSIFPIAEMQSRWFCELMLGRCRPLPELPVMMSEVKHRRTKLKSQYYEGAKHSVQVEFVSYMEELARQFGVRPNMWEYFTTDPKLWYKLLFGPLVSYQYRLTGPGSWHDARRAVMEVDERIEKPLQTRAGALKNSGLSNQIVIILTIFLMAIVYYYFF